MSESLLFAILGFLVACLLGTVFASFLWRRAVTVTTRKITEDENFAAMDEVADLRADLRAAQNGLATKDREIVNAQARAADLETALSEAQASGEGTTENLKRELENAGKALEAAQGERDAAQAALSDKDSEVKAALKAKDGEIEQAQARVSLLENAIRTLAKEASLFETEPVSNALTTSVPAAEVTTDSPDPEGAPDTPVATEDMPKEAPEPETPLKDVSKDDAAEAEPEPQQASAISRSLEERIEALKQGESPTA